MKVIIRKDYDEMSGYVRIYSGNCTVALYNEAASELKNRDTVNSRVLSDQNISSDSSFV